MENKRHLVIIKEVKEYRIEVEGAENNDQAEEMARNHPYFVHGISDDLDSEVMSIEEIK